MKRKWLLIAIMAMLMLFFAACGRGGGGVRTRPDHWEGDTVFYPQTFTAWDGWSTGAGVQWHDTEVGRLIQEITGITIQMEFNVGASAEERAALIIASGDFPDIILPWHAFDAFRDAGALIPLNDLFDRYAPNIQALWGDSVNRTLDPDTGIMWGIANMSYGTPPMAFPTAGFYMRASVAAANDWRVFTDPDDFFDAIRRYVAENPYNSQGQSNIGFTGPSEGWRFVFTLHGGNRLHGWHNTGDFVYDPNNNWRAQSTCIFPPRRDYLLRLWELNQEGLLDPEMLSQSHDEYVAKIASGRVVAFYDETWQVNQAFNLIAEDNRPMDLFIPMPIVYGNIPDTYMGIAAVTPRPALSITTAARDPEAIIMFVDFLASEEMLTLRYWGIEGVHYQRNAAGRRYLTREQYAERDVPGWSDRTGVGMHMGSPGPMQLAAERPDGSGVWSPAYDPARAQFIYSDAHLYVLGHLGWDRFVDPFAPMWRSPYGFGWDINVPPDNDFLVDLQHNFNLLDSHIVYQRMIMAADRAEFDSHWNTFIERVEALNIQPLLDFREEEVRRRVREW